MKNVILLLALVTSLFAQPGWVKEADGMRVEEVAMVVTSHASQEYAEARARIELSQRWAHAHAFKVLRAYYDASKKRHFILMGAIVVDNNPAPVGKTIASAI